MDCWWCLMIKPWIYEIRFFLFGGGDEVWLRRPPNLYVRINDEADYHPLMANGFKVELCSIWPTVWSSSGKTHTLEWQILICWWQILDFLTVGSSLFPNPGSCHCWARSLLPSSVFGPYVTPALASPLQRSRPMHQSSARPCKAMRMPIHICRWSSLWPCG